MRLQPAPRRSARRPGRPGITLTEVLVAMFIMAVGMLALLTLFPLGAMQVGQALRDDRCSQTGLQGDAYIRSYYRHEIVANYRPDTSTKTEPEEPFFPAMDDPNLYFAGPPTNVPNPAEPPKKYSGGPLSGKITGNAFLPAPLQLPAGINLPKTMPSQPISPVMLSGDKYLGPPQAAEPGLGYHRATQALFAANGTPSYPVLVDPLGFTNSVAARPLSKYWVAGGAFPPLSPPAHLLMGRRTLRTIGDNANNATLAAAMTDDIEFQANGTPSASGGTYVHSRQGRYTWAVLLQRPKNEVRPVANVQVLVFDGRSRLLTTDDEAVTTAVDNQAAGDRNLKVLLAAPASIESPLLVRRGGYVLHAPMDGATLASFHRITGVVERAVGTNIEYTLDLETPLKSGIAAGGNPTLYFFAGLAEVFQRSQLRPDVGY